MSLEEKIREYIKESGVSHKETQGSYVFDCPRCGKKDRLWMYKSSGYFQCFYCKEKNGFFGKPEFALSELLDTDISTVRSFIYERIKENNPLLLELDFVDPYNEPEEIHKNKPFADITETHYTPDYFSISHKFSKKGLEYLKQRGITEDLANTYKIHYKPLNQRVSFPVYFDSKLYGWQDRIVVDNVFFDVNGDKKEIPKTLTLKGLKKDKVLMFADNLVGAKQAILCEGPVDAIKCHLCTNDGLPAGNVATMGKAVSDAQLDIIEYFGIKKVYIGLDPDAVDEIKSLATRLFDRGIAAYKINIPDKFKDIGEMTLQEAKNAYLNAEDMASTMSLCYFNPGILEKK